MILEDQIRNQTLKIDELTLINDYLYRYTSQLNYTLSEKEEYIQELEG